MRFHKSHGFQDKQLLFLCHVSCNSEAAWLICFAVYTRASAVLERLHQNPHCVLTLLNNLYVLYECFWRKAHNTFNIPEINHPLPIRVAARSQAWVCDPSLDGIAGSNPAGCMDVCLLWVLCAVRYRSLHRADQSSRRVLPSVVSVNECGREASVMRRL